MKKKRNRRRGAASARRVPSAPRARAPCGGRPVQAQQQAPCAEKAGPGRRPAGKSEEFQMEQTNTPQRPQQDGAAPAESAKRRRRRGGRRHKSGGQGPAAASQAPQKKRVLRRRSSKKEKPANAPRGKNGRGEKAEHAPRAEKSAKSAKRSRAFPRWTTASSLSHVGPLHKKYASFEEYMKAHEE